MRVCSLFSGIGGIDLAFQQAGFQVVWANEIDKYAANTYAHNLGSFALTIGDIAKVEISEIPEFDVLVAGFPCQPFSTAGKLKGFNDDRGELFFQIAKVVEAKKPQVIFLENVANLLEHDEGKSFLTVYNALAPLGYAFRYQVLEPYDYGNIPQGRSRIFIVGFKDEKKCENFRFPEKIQLTQNLGQFFDRSIKHSDCYYYNESNKYYGELKQIVKQKDCVYRIFDSGVVKKPYYNCPALTAYMGNCFERVPIFLDDYGIRRLTPYECLKLQGFPDDYKFAPGTPMRKAYKQVGNSVCVPVIRKIVEQIKKVME